MEFSATIKGLPTKKKSFIVGAAETLTAETDAPRGVRLCKANNVISLVKFSCAMH